MKNVAADRDRQSVDPALVATDGQRIQQSLRRMFVRAVARVDDRAVDFSREQVDRAGRGMAHDDDVRPHGVQRDRRVDQRLALLHAGIGDRHVHDVCAEPLSREFERRLRAGGRLEEQIDLRAPAQRRALLLDLAGDVDRLFGEIEKTPRYQAAKALRFRANDGGGRSAGAQRATSAGSMRERRAHCKRRRRAGARIPQRRGSDALGGAWRTRGHLDPAIVDGSMGGALPDGVIDSLLDRSLGKPADDQGRNAAKA